MSKLKYLLCLLMFTFGCAVKEQQVVIKDVLDIPQTNFQFLETIKPDEEYILTPTKQALFIKQYEKMYFTPWTNSFDKLVFDQKNFNSMFDKYFNSPGFGANKLMNEKTWVNSLFENANTTNYPNLIKRAITIKNTNLRLMPTNEPRFIKTDGYPFDLLQNSRVLVNTPVLITQISKDKEWVYVQTNFASGWTPIQDLAFVDENMLQEWMKFRPAIVILDNLACYDKNENFVTRLAIGTRIFAELDEQTNKYKFFIAQKNENNQATKMEITNNNDGFNVGYLAVTKTNATNIAEMFLGQKYGWGGLFGYRDCSAMIQDYFSVFGIWMPRNSKAQIEHKNYAHDLSKMTNKEKKKYITKNAVPYFTIIWMQGHIMLYVGENNGEPLVLHNIWGLKINHKHEYTNIVGKTVITTLNPAKEIKGLKKGILERVGSMRIITDEKIEESEIRL